MKKTLSVILVLSLLAAVLCGCTSSEVRTYTEPTEDPGETTDTPTDTADTSESDGYEIPDYTYAYEKFEPDAVVMTVDGVPVYWDEYFYWMMDAMYLVAYYDDYVTDWDASCLFDTSMTYDEYIKEYTDSTVKMYHSMENKANELGITLTDEDTAYIDSLWQSDIDSTGSEEELIEQIKQIFLNKELYYYINRVSVLADSTFTELYGSSGEKLDDEEILGYGEDNGYLRVKHILFKTTDDEGNTLSDEEVAAKKQTAEEVLAQLKEAGDSETLEALFDELMNEYSEDTGLTVYPDGYCFTNGDMVEEFLTASAALEEYEVSELVTSSFGYHIILRLPLRAEDVPINDGTNNLRFLAASSMFNSNIDNWSDETTIVWSEEFENLTPAQIFAQ